MNEQIVILGNGGLKTSQTAQDSPDLIDHFNEIQKVAFVIKSKISNGQIQVVKKQLIGELSFFTKPHKHE